MRALYLIILTFTYGMTSAQTKAKSEGSTSHSYDLVFGYNLYTQKLSQPLNTTSTINLSLPVKFIGIGASSGYTKINDKYPDSKANIAEQFYFNYFLPQNITVDTINFKVSGFSFNAGLGKSLHNKTYHLNLIAYLGFNTGRMVFKSEEYKKQQNVFFSPKFTIQPKVIIKKLALSVICEYQYDITNTIWLTKDFKQDINSNKNKFNQSGFSVMLSAGYHIHY